jgi:hypothetical protein
MPAAGLTCLLRAWPAWRKPYVADLRGRGGGMPEISIFLSVIFFIEHVKVTVTRDWDWLRIMLLDRNVSEEELLRVFKTFPDAFNF